MREAVLRRCFVNNSLLEIGCEEIPARFMPALLDDLKKKTEEKLKANKIEYSKIETLGTPRRLTLYIEGLFAKQPDTKDEIKGPPTDIAQAVQGFAKKMGVAVNSLIIRTEGNRNFAYAIINKKGQLTSKIFETLFPEIINSLHLPISMRWGSGDYKFIRPIHWILALCGDKIVKFSFAGVKSSSGTKGHRFSINPNSEFRNPNIELYKKVLLKLGVVVDQNERKEMIRKTVKKAAPLALIDEALLDEVNYLVEYPYAVVCSFNPDYLTLPKEVLITTMKKNQKDFPVVNEKGKLEPKFVVVTNGCKNKGVKDGNQRVVSARLSDAKFFFDEDRKIPLNARVADLKKVQFFEGLGDTLQRTERIMKLSAHIAKALKVDERQMPTIEKTAQLSKADLITQMVFEFPELQGVMGREYALLSGEEKQVSDGIYEHYLPRFAEDALPKTVPGIIVSLADKIDIIMGCFALGKIPTGSIDPYGLRRAAFGIIKVIIANKLELQIDGVFNKALSLYSGILRDVNFEKVFKQILEFIGIRLKGLMLEEGIPYDLIDASFANLTNILYVYQIAHTLKGLRQEAWFVPLVKTQDRCYRISSSAAREQVIEHDLQDEAEKKLFEVYLKVNWEAEEKINKGDYQGAIHAFSKLSEPVEMFFEKVLVMHQDERIKTNRLALLKTLNNLFLKVADFRKIVV